MKDYEEKHCLRSDVSFTVRPWNKNVNRVNSDFVCDFLCQCLPGLIFICKCHSFTVNTWGQIYYTYESSGRCLFILISPLVWFLHRSDLKKHQLKGRGAASVFPPQHQMLALPLLYCPWKSFSHLQPEAICFASVQFWLWLILDDPRCQLSKSKIDLGSCLYTSVLS